MTRVTSVRQLSGSSGCHTLEEIEFLVELEEFECGTCSVALFFGKSVICISLFINGISLSARTLSLLAFPIVLRSAFRKFTKNFGSF